MSAAPRVLVVDDSAFVRKVVREVLSGAGMDVVGHARDGLEALEKIEALAPDVVTLDLMMPELDGLAVLEALATQEAPPAVVVVTNARAGSESGVRALQLGAIALVEKPTALASSRLYLLGEELAREVRLAAEARGTLAIPAEHPVALVPPPPPRGNPRVDVIVVGTSTGGPQALTKLLGALPADLEVPLVIALHIPPGYTEALAARLDRSSALQVCEARGGMRLEPGKAVIARAGMHARLERRDGGLVVALGFEPAEALHRPSVDVLFESAARTCGSRALGVVLTGMGSDGVEGARALWECGATVFTESEASCVVWGMPRAVWRAGLSHEQRPLEQLPAALLRHLRG